MRLTQINLAGFKSFVDPTHIPVPGQLVGIVGPNGCGKSNVIDAVRWVLGETSAKHLRGESMQDVLFNGSGDRKPVNRASVELMFDNSLGRAGGQWSQYAEISVKRVLERDGESSYYINNIHVRRRDVQDIFLGTGLGARAYAIIEQGMISRVIEAKPEELRVFLEEAAGVSKYRERRKETEYRLRDTRENLLRVDDIREELTKQLEHLQGQAEVAKNYHELQARLTTTQNLLWLTRRNEAASARARHNREIERLSVEIEAETARLRDAEKRLEELRAQNYEAGDAVHKAQGALYESNAEVARLEQQIAHLRENRERIEHQITTLRTQLENSQSQLITAQRNLDEWRGEHTRAQERQALLEQQVAEEAERLPVAEEASRTAAAQRDENQRMVAQTEQSIHVEQTKLSHAERVLDQLSQRANRLTEERTALPPADEAAQEELRGQLFELETELAAAREALAASETALPELEATLRTRVSALDEAVQAARATEARSAALQQIQDRLSRGAELEGWLAQRGLDQAPRLWQGITIEPGWEDALEGVLRERLNGVTVADLATAGNWLSDTPPGKLTVVDTADGEHVGDAPAFQGMESLRRYVGCRNPGLAGVLQEWLHDVYVIADLNAGLAMRHSLPAGVMLVTREGHVCTRHSVSFHAPDSELHGVLSRQREIETLQATAQQQHAAEESMRDALASAEAALEQHKHTLAATRHQVTDSQQRQHQLQLEALRVSEQVQRILQRAEQIDLELSEITRHTEEESAHREMAAAAIAELQATLEERREALAVASEQFALAEQALRSQRDALQQIDREHQEALFQVRNYSNKINEIEGSLGGLAANIESLSATLEEEHAALAQCDDEPWQAQLQQALTLRSEREYALAYARDAAESLETQMRELEQERLACEQKIGPLRDRVNDVRLKEQEARLTEEQYAQQLFDSGAAEEELAALLEKGMRSSGLQGDINRLSEEIKALGAVNLAALEELEAAQERKAYLDAQSADLNEAMTTLEDAIRRIDRETRERLQETFDQVNQHFSTMFPALFGGGNARLLLTGEEILDSGIQVIAQPPGKKNSSIHLLSGGEKALTAMSLVFAIFQLNPAPFCLLDEVDAPLDDHNTERFCNLVKQMSASSQFMFISHNKITMEMANQLLGITMQEPGVSRVVAVDMEEAMKMSEAA